MGADPGGAAQKLIGLLEDPISDPPDSAGDTGAPSNDRDPPAGPAPRHDREGLGRSRGGLSTKIHLLSRAVDRQHVRRSLPHLAPRHPRASASVRAPWSKSSSVCPGTSLTRTSSHDAPERTPTMRGSWSGRGGSHFPFRDQGGAWLRRVGAVSDAAASARAGAAGLRPVSTRRAAAYLAHAPYSS